MVKGEECLTADFKFGDAATSSRGLNLVGCGKGPTVTGWAANCSSAELTRIDQPISNGCFLTTKILTCPPGYSTSAQSKKYNMLQPNDARTMPNHHHQI